LTRTSRGIRGAEGIGWEGLSGGGEGVGWRGGRPAGGEGVGWSGESRGKRWLSFDLCRR
jgi:hypothetical protein